ncbi:transposase [Micromonospora sp. NBC_01405]|uniref:transposase n=1 Tax=Micromonospora sp. NBC_01405 TaxID=2903589 RepID=UPI00325146EC
MEQVRVPRPGGVGRPRQRPDSLTGDKAYSSRANRTALRDKGITTVIPEPNDQIANRKRNGRRGGRPPRFDKVAYRCRNQAERGFNRRKHWRGLATRYDKVAYRCRNQAERGFNRRKHWRGLATRYDKLAAHFQATLHLVETLDWLRAVPDHQDPQDRT